MSNIPLPAVEREPFTWHSAFDQRGYLPAEMDTGHLFRTLRMIWNHSCPIEHRIEPVRLYKFEARYTPAYMRDAVLHISAELAARPDIENYMRRDLERMVRWLRAPEEIAQ